MGVMLPPGRQRYKEKQSQQVGSGGRKRPQWARPAGEALTVSTSSLPVPIPFPTGQLKAGQEEGRQNFSDLPEGSVHPPL